MINIIAKIFAVPVKIINILLSVLLVFTPFARVAGIIFYILLIPLVGFGLFGGETPDWETVLTALLFPTILTFAEVPIQLLIQLCEHFANWLINTDHRSARVQNEEYIASMKLEKKRAEDDSCEKEIQEIAAKLKEIYERGG